MDEQQAYQTLHEENPHYQSNNWLMDELDAIAPAGNAGTFVEIGCGNGRFLALAAERFERVIGVDFARSPVIDEVLSGTGAGADKIEFLQADLTTDALDLKADVVASADVLEHIAPDDLDGVIARMDAVSPKALHKIACYPDEWRHPSVFTPEEWGERFRAINGAYSVRSVEHRRGRENQPVVTIVKGFD